MAEAIAIKIEKGKPVEGTAEWLALAASSAFHELFPDDWKRAMTILAQSVNRMVLREDWDSRPNHSASAPTGGTIASGPCGSLYWLRRN
jgi:hypothetical protein